MNSRVERQTVDLSSFPDLVVIYLGMRVNTLTGVKTLFGFGPQIRNSVDQRPDGLLLHENFILSLIPLHLGMRQYWRDFDALEAWARSTPHRECGATSFDHLAVRAFGTKLISCVVAWRLFTTMYRFPWASDNSRHYNRPVDRCSQLARGPSWLAKRRPPLLRRPSFMPSRTRRSRPGWRETTCA
jgi:hypothetical protein